MATFSTFPVFSNMSFSHRLPPFVHRFLKKTPSKQWASTCNHMATISSASIRQRFPQQTRITDFLSNIRWRFPQHSSSAPTRWRFLPNECFLSSTTILEWLLTSREVTDVLQTFTTHPCMTTAAFLICLSCGKWQDEELRNRGEPWFRATASPSGKQVLDLVWVDYKDAPLRRLLVELHQARPAWWRPRGRPRNRSRDCISHLAWEHFGSPESVAEVRVVRNNLPLPLWWIIKEWIERRKRMNESESCLWWPQMACIWN